MKRDPIASLRLPDFRFFISARLFMTLGTQMQGLIVSWQIYQYTKDPFWLGMIGLTEAIPFISTALFAGHIADIIERKKIIIRATVVLLLCTALLCAFTLNNGFVLSVAGVWPIYAVVFITGLARAFIAPSYFAFLSQIVPRSEYSNASTWSSTTWQAGAVGGLTIGGLIYAMVGFTYSYVIVSGLLLIALFSVLAIAGKPLPPKEKKEDLFDSLAMGVRFVFKNEAILGALTLDLFAVLFGGAVALLPIFADKILMVGPVGLGFLRAAPAVGAVAMAAVMVYKPPVHNAGRNLLVCVTGFGICMICFALSSNFYLSMFILALSGAFDSVSVVIRATIIQLMTPDEMRGRVSAVNNIFIGSSNEIGEFESGMAAKIMRLIPSVIFGGSMTIIVVAITAFKAKKLRKLHLE
ncbi:MAG: MFS transporter [Bacteroidia bacterium]